MTTYVCNTGISCLPNGVLRRRRDQALDQQICHDMDVAGYYNTILHTTIVLLTRYLDT